MAKSKIYEQQEALSAYFNEMLADQTQAKTSVVSKPERPEVKLALKQTVIFPSEDIAPATEETVTPKEMGRVTTPTPFIEADTESSEDVITETDSAIEQQTPTDVITEAETTADSTQTEDRVLKILLCDIGGMKVAIKVDTLDNIIRWPSQGLNHIPGRKSWEVGLLSDNGQNTNVIDVRTLLHTPNNGSPLQASYILLVNDRRTGIACDSIEQIINKNSREINWRHDTSQRPWFTGVLSETMHSVLDIPAIINALE